MNLFLIPPDKRLRNIEMTAELSTLSQAIVEKDFWVVWALWRLFDQKDLNPHLTFKGGTSLSKVFGVIDRFSEDVDLTIEKGFFGFDSEKAPEQAPSRKKRTAALKDLSAHCSEYVRSVLFEDLKKDFSNHLAHETSDWDITIDEGDPDLQTLLFHYPTVVKQGSKYVRPFVRLEMGARSEHWPVYERPVQTYIKEYLKDKIEEPKVMINVLAIERTFWEKVTILHQFAHKPAEKPMPARLARHYYDMHCLISSPAKEKAAQDTDLLARVVKHKELYFPASWANMETAKKGTLKLVPSDELLTELERDYTVMREMFIGTPPEWKNVVDSIAEFEKEFNGN